MHDSKTKPSLIGDPLERGAGLRLRGRDAAPLIILVTLGANECAVVEGRVRSPLGGELGAHRPQSAPRREELHVEYSAVHFLCCDLSLSNRNSVKI